MEDIKGSFGTFFLAFIVEKFISYLTDPPRSDPSKSAASPAFRKNLETWHKYSPNPAMCCILAKNKRKLHKEDIAF